MRGKPCVCGPGGALDESAHGGGCLVVDRPSVDNLSTALERLLTDRTVRTRLSAEARARQFRSWSEYARNLRDWMRTLPRRA
jgi:glycosyltransferase involved in cell wall biosynthesis